MRRFLALFLCLFLLLPGAGAESTYLKEKKPILAVFCNPDAVLINTWAHYKPDVFTVAFSWDQLDPFLKETKQRAAGRPIELDFEVHGEEYLSISYRNNITSRYEVKHATMGYVLNHVEKILGKKNVTVLFESCYAGYVYKKSIRGNIINPFLDIKAEDHKGIPSYPVYGGTYDHMNVNNFVFLQYRTNTRAYFCDLRYYEDHGGGAKDRNDNSEVHKNISLLWDILASLYNP